MFGHDLYKAGVQGVILGAFTKFQRPDALLNVTMLGNRVPLYMAAGAAGIGASLAGDILHEWVLPHIPKNQKFSKSESAVISPLLTAGSYIGMYYLLNPGSIDELGMFNLAVQGVAADFGATYVMGMM
jgi:hypothetical protein